jgi:hypothetical protein
MIAKDAANRSAQAGNEGGYVNFLFPESFRLADPATKRRRPQGPFAKPTRIGRVSFDNPVYSQCRVPLFRWSASRDNPPRGKCQCAIVAGATSVQIFPSNCADERGAAVRIRHIALRGVVFVVSAAIALGIVAGSMEFADHCGWIVHRRAATVWAQQNWQSVEDKSCRLLGDMQMPELLCDPGVAPETRRVEFRGSLHAKQWLCRQQPARIMCRTK